MIASFKYWYNSSFFPCRREMLPSKAQVEYMPKNRNENGRTAFYDEARDIIKSNRFQRARDNNSEECERQGRSTEQQLL
jgi:hypothetical protein